MKNQEQPRKLHKFTVLLLYPEYLADTFGQDTYLAWVEAPDLPLAIKAARAQVGRANRAKHKDFYVLFLCAGHIRDLVCFGDRNDRTP